MNVAIIGCGYVGMAIARFWQDQGHTVTATTTTPARTSQLEPIAQRVVLVRGDDAATLQSVVADQEIVLLSVGAPNADAYETTYLQTAKTLATVLEQAPTVQQVIYTGSYAVYGDQGGVWVDEETPIAPANRNGEILAQTEQALLAANCDRRKVCVLRLGGIYGPGRELVKIFGRAAGTTRPGTGDDPTNWIHLDDIVGAIEFARQQQLQGIYNLVNNVPIASRELIDRVCEQHQLPKVSWDPSLPKVRPYNAKVSNQKLRAAGYALIHPEVTV